MDTEHCIECGVVLIEGVNQSEYTIDMCMDCYAADYANDIPEKPLDFSEHYTEEFPEIDEDEDIGC